MKRKVILTCAVTGGGAYGPNSRYVPKSPADIAESAIGAARAGAAIVHLHVRDPETGEPSMKFEYYEETVRLIRESGSDVIINLTTGMGARIEAPLTDDDVAQLPMTPAARTRHVEVLRPEVCTLDVATMNGAAHAIVNSPAHLREQARMIRAAGVKPELEVFDLGHIDVAKRLLAEGALPQPPLFQLCLGVAGGAPATVEGMLMMRSLLPEGAIWSAFGISRQQMPMLALSITLGGHCRVGLEDNLYAEYGVLAESNAELVEKAITIIRALGAEPATPDEARKMLSISQAASSDAA